MEQPSRLCPNRFSNLSSLTSIAITMDTDWAPEYMVRQSLEILASAKVKATIFLTSTYQCVKEYNNGLFEFGIHPNFAANNSKTVETVAALRAIVPDARGTRSHNLIQSTPILTEIARLGFSYDCSHIFFNVPYLSAYCDWNNLVRIPYYWEDDIHCLYRLPWTMLPFLEAVPGLKIFNFHPVHVYLNTETLDRYEQLKNTGIPLPQLSAEQVSGYINTGTGTQTLLKELLAETNGRQLVTYQLSEVADAVRAEY
ncbi:MAG: hypothetical protein AB1489_05450 [Acidobacteriota bacterium]